MITIRRSEARGFANHGWLKSRHTFSFADYYDPDYMGFGVLRVINEDKIEGGTGFGAHPHNNMEIVSYVVQGELYHKDSMGTESIIKPGDVQRMSAGAGVVHSEYNHLQQDITHFLQIWILPDKQNIASTYEQKSFVNEFSSGELVLIVSKAGNEGSISINQDINVYACQSKARKKQLVKANSSRLYWVQVINGAVSVENEHLETGDGAGVSNVEGINLEWDKASEFLLFDLPKS